MGEKMRCDARRKGVELGELGGEMNLVSSVVWPLRKLIPIIVVCHVAFGCSEGLDGSASSGVEPGDTIQISDQNPFPDQLLSGSSQCQYPPSENEEPSFASWVQSADTIFVGTIASISVAQRPIYHWEYGEVLGPITEEECDGTIRWIAEIEFIDVETLYGEPVGSRFEFVLQEGLYEWLNAFPNIEEETLVDVEGNEVYFPGARIGGALYQANTGDYMWRYRHFAVVDDHLILQPVGSLCPRALTQIVSIPDEFEGLRLQQFESEIETHSMMPLSPVEAEVLARHDQWVGSDREAHHFAHKCITFPDSEQEPHPAEGDREFDD